MEVRVVALEELVEGCVALAEEGEEQVGAEVEDEAQRNRDSRIKKIWRTSYFLP